MCFLGVCMCGIYGTAEFLSLVCRSSDEAGDAKEAFFFCLCVCRGTRPA